MTKRLAAKVGEYQKDGQTKGEYVKLGVVLSNDNGEYLLLDPSVSLAGVLAKQNALASAKGQQLRDNVMVSVFTDQPQQSAPQQGGGYQQQRQQPPQQQPAQGQPGGYVPDDIPF